MDATPLCRNEAAGRSGQGGLYFERCSRIDRRSASSAVGYG